MDVLALADDLTGAIEAGAQFAAAGAQAVVTIASAECGSNAAPQVLVIDTESRHLPPEEAAARVYEPAHTALLDGIRMVYKKTDSTLRGNIGAELGALVRAGSGAPLVYAPAYPRMGRTVRGGRLYVEGMPVECTAFARDPLDPVRESRIARVLAAQTDAPIDVWDGETEGEIEAAAQAALPRRMAAGPAALAGALARLLYGYQSPDGIRWPRLRSALVVNGSLHPASSRQVAHAVSHSRPGDGWTILPTPAPSAVCAALERSRPDALIIFGGDTAFGILGALGHPSIHPIGELLPGVPLSRIAHAGRELWLITKAGGFGPPDVLTRIREMIGLIAP